MDESELIQPTVLPDWSGALEALRRCIAFTPQWQYEVYFHTSKEQRITGSVLLKKVNISGVELLLPE